MATAAKDINWKYFGDALPAFLTIAIMPFTYSIAYGLIAGIVSYIVLNTIAWMVEKASGGRIVPADKEFKEPWTYKIKGGLLPGWIVRAASGYVSILFSILPPPFSFPSLYISPSCILDLR